MSKQFELLSWLLVKFAENTLVLVEVKGTKGVSQVVVGEKEPR